VKSSEAQSMPETHEQYLLRLGSYIEGQDPIAIQSQTAPNLAQLIAGLSAEQLSVRPSPEKWSATEVLAHMAEDEIATAWRYRQMIERDGGPLSGFDQDLWATLGNYAAWPPHDALELFRLLREANLRMLATLSPEQWERSGQHAERGRLTVRALARHMAAHDINHLRQIETLLRPAPHL
jgi:uncharacterized damage-inducible protein DinB